ncbi:hypothetical protein DIPPA_23613 [Diplonema papillatum]|nr:hypothetical protein DIPPA_23613 [Diplonema papillatum]
MMRSRVLLYNRKTPYEASGIYVVKPPTPAEQRAVERAREEHKRAKAWIPSPKDSPAGDLPPGRVDQPAALAAAKETADRIERMLSSSQPAGGALASAAAEQQIANPDPAATKDAAPAPSGEDSIAARLQGRRASSVAQWYRESRKKPSGQLDTVIRTKSLLHDTQYVQSLEDAQVADALWTAYHAIFIVAVFTLGMKYAWGQDGRFFIPRLEMRRETMEDEEFHSDEDSEERYKLKKYGWYYKWKGAVWSRKRAELLGEENHDFLDPAGRGSRIWQQTRFQYYQATDYISDLFSW